ncbi:helitron_like_N domain-containing protein [Trichonephila clavipes]|nr:helitron_like_N domain-containing protein [Trichonephila clavipes]
MRTRPCVRPLRFSLQRSPRTGSKKKFPLGLESGKISRTQLQLSEEWKVWRTQLQLSEECGKQSPRIPFMQIRRLRHVLGQFGIYGQVINVPMEKENTQIQLSLWYSQQKKNKSVVATFKRFTPLYTSYGITVDDSFFNGQDDIQDEIIYDEDGDNDISEQIPIDESLVAQQQTLMRNDEMYLTIAPGEGNVPVSLLFDEHAEELSFPQIYLGQFRTFRDGVNVTSFMMATSELRRSDRRGVTLSICYTWL